MTVCEPDEGRHLAAVLALEAFASHAHAVVLLHAHEPVIIWQNGASKELFLDHAISRSAGRITLPHRTLQPHFDEFLDGAGSEPSTWVLIGDGPEQTLIFRCRRVHRDGAGIGRMLTIHSPAQPATVLPDIRTLFGLTPAEMKVVHCLVDGMRADDLAVHLNITLETARTHIRRVYNKMDVSSREQLLALTNRYRVP